jgi:hypothetical protein
MQQQIAALGQLRVHFKSAKVGSVRIGSAKQPLRTNHGQREIHDAVYSWPWEAWQRKIQLEEPLRVWMMCSTLLCW